MGRSIRESNRRIPMGHASQPPMGLRALNHLPLTCSKIATFYWNIAIIEHSRGLSMFGFLEGADQKEMLQLRNMQICTTLQSFQSPQIDCLVFSA